MSWTQVAPQLGSATVITSTVVMGGELYGGTNTGSLLKWNGTNAWTQVAAAIGYTYVCSMAVWGGEIYAYVGYGANDGRDVYKFTGSAWAAQGVTSSDCSILVTFAGDLYAIGGSGNASDSLIKVKPSVVVVVATPVGNNAMCGIEFSALIWAVFSDGTVRTSDGVTVAAFTTKHTFSGEYGTAIASHGGELYVGTSIGKLYKWNGASFDLQATQSDGYAITSLLSFNSKLYAGLSS